MNTYVVMLLWPCCLIVCCLESTTLTVDRLVADIHLPMLLSPSSCCRLLPFFAIKNAPHLVARMPTTMP